jgi:hypothetical protein
MDDDVPVSIDMLTESFPNMSVKGVPVSIDIEHTTDDCLNQSICVIRCGCFYDDNSCKLTSDEHWQYNYSGFPDHLFNYEYNGQHGKVVIDGFNYFLYDFYNALLEDVGENISISLNLSILVHYIDKRSRIPLCRGMKFSHTFDICLEDISGIEIDGYDFDSSGACGSL